MLICPCEFAVLQPLGHGRENSRFCNFSGLTSLYLSLNDSLSLSLSRSLVPLARLLAVWLHMLQSVASWQTSCSHQMGSHSALQAFVGPRVLLTAASGLMSYGPDLAHALGSAIAPHVEAIVQQRTSAAMALFVNTIHPDTISQVYGEQGNRRRAQEFMCQHADGLLQQHMQGASAAQQPKPEVLQKEDEQPEQVASENAKAKHASRGGAKRIGKYRVETGVLEIFARFTPDLPGTTAPTARPADASQQSSSHRAQPDPPASKSAPPPPPPLDPPPELPGGGQPKDEPNNLQPPPSPERQQHEVSSQAQHSAVPLPKTPPKARAPAKARPPTSSNGEIPRLPKHVGVLAMLFLGCHATVDRQLKFNPKFN